MVSYNEIIISCCTLLLLCAMFAIIIIELIKQLKSLALILGISVSQLITLFLVEHAFTNYNLEATDIY